MSEAPAPPKSTTAGRQGRPGRVAAFGIGIAVIAGALWLARMPLPEGGLPESYEDDTGIEYLLVRPQPFRMGENAAFPDEGPARDVELTAPFYIGLREVANRDYRRYLEATQARYGPATAFADGARDAWPVVNVSYRDALAYIAWYNRHTGDSYRLPSEAEWEFLATQAPDALAYACDFANTRGGSYDASLAPSTNLLNATGGVNDSGCVDEWPVLADVDAASPDGLGLYHLYGNAAEWVADCYAAGYESAPADGSANETDGCGQRVYRGGSWLSPAAWLSPTLRAIAPPDYRDFHVGFRLARGVGVLESRMLANPDRDWETLFRVFRWTCYGIAIATFLVLLLWLLRRRSRVPPPGPAGDRADDESAPRAADSGQVHQQRKTQGPEPSADSQPSQFDQQKHQQ